MNDKSQQGAEIPAHVTLPIPFPGTPLWHAPSPAGMARARARDAIPGGAFTLCHPMLSAAGAFLWEAQHHRRGRDHLLPPGLCHRQPGLPGTGVGIGPQLQVPTGTGEGGCAEMLGRHPSIRLSVCGSLPSLCLLPLRGAEMLGTPLLGIRAGRDTPIPGEGKGDRSQRGTGLAQSPCPGTALLSGCR